MSGGGDSTAEDDRDHTISSSSSESRSLVHLVLEDAAESMSSDDEGDREVVGMVGGIFKTGEEGGTRDGRLESFYYYYPRRDRGSLVHINIG